MKNTKRRNTFYGWDAQYRAATTHEPDPIWVARNSTRLKCAVCGERVIGMGTTVQPWRHE